MFKNYIKTAWRNIRKNKISSTIKIAGLSVGMTAAVLILLWVKNETSFDEYKDSKAIYRLTTHVPSTGWVWETTPLLLADAVKKEIPGIEATTRLYTSNWPIFNISGSLFYGKNCAYVDKDWFSIFHYTFIEGNVQSFSDHPFSIILTASAAKNYFGNANATGQIIRIDTMNYLVSGVVADAPINSSFQYNAFIPIAALLTNSQIRENDEQWNNANYISFVKMSAGANPVITAQKISALLKEKSNDNDAATISMTALNDMHFETEIQNSAFVHGNINTVYIFSFLGLLLLLIACINYVNLTTANASLRAKEVSIRKITGASRSSLFLQFVTESVMISLLSLLLTLVLVQFCLPIFNELTGRTFELPLTSPGLWQVLLITVLAATLLNSIYPALLLSSFKPLNVFRGATLLKLSDSGFRKTLVVLQFTISITLIAGTIIIFSQLQFIQKNNPGYNRSQVISFVLPPTVNRDKREGLIRSMKQELLSQANVNNVAVSNQPVVNIGSTCTQCADWEGRDTSYNPKIAQLSADADFLKTMQLQMREGKWFNADGSAGKEFILNETAAKEFNLHIPVTGQRFIFKGDTGKVIGVVKDFYFKSMHEKIGPVIVFNNPAWQNNFVVRTAGASPVLALAAIEKTWKRFLPGTPLEYTFMDDTFNNLYKEDKRASFLVLAFAIIAIIISALGLFSLAAFEAQQRTKEIGIRKVLGATVAGIAATLSKDFIRLVCIAILIASPVAWWAMSKWLQNFTYRVSISWWMFALAGALAIFIALLTISFQAIKAAIANPVKSLRTE